MKNKNTRECRSSHSISRRGSYSGEIYTTGPPGIFRPQTAITVYFCQVSKYVIGAYNV